ncbi:MAG: TatD family hydrolase [Gammaproteobacteria bacterium]
MYDLIDIGLNLTASAFSQDLPDVLARAQEAGVRQMVVTGTDIEHSRQAEALTRQYPGLLYATAGVHPHHAKDCNDQTLAQLELLAKQQGVVAIGECGLDFNRNFSPRDVQIQWFEAQLELASGLGLPVFLHQRDGHKEFVEILSIWRPRLINAVAHCFTGGMEQVKSYLDLDLHLGVTGWICDERRGQDLQQAVQYIPLNRLMIETDAPYLLPRDLSPKPKDRRNEPRYLPHICEAVAHHRNEEVDDVAQQTSQTATNFFGLGQ